jgi:hypothetical protein
MSESKPSDPSGGSQPNRPRDYSIAFLAAGIAAITVGAGLFHPGAGLILMGVTLTVIGIVGGPRRT